MDHKQTKACLKQAKINKEVIKNLETSQVQYMAPEETQQAIEGGCVPFAVYVIVRLLKVIFILMWFLFLC